MMDNPAGNEQSGLKIIGAGFGRTGTLSLKAALEELGFGPCYHMTEVFQHPAHMPIWEAAANGQPIDWHKLFEGYHATVDWPACTFYKALMQAYPDAKVLLSVRDPEKWYDSVLNTIYQIRNRTATSSTSAALFLLMKTFIPWLRNLTRMLDALIWEGTFHGRLTDKDYAISIYNQHNAEVKQYVPSEKLLVFNVKEGWEPLCAFLDVPIPQNKPFPHLNDRASFLTAQRLRTFGRVLATAFVTSVLALLVFLWRHFHRKK